MNDLQVKYPGSQDPRLILWRQNLAFEAFDWEVWNQSPLLPRFWRGANQRSFLWHLCESVHNFLTFCHLVNLAEIFLLTVSWLYNSSVILASDFLWFQGMCTKKSAISPSNFRASFFKTCQWRRAPILHKLELHKLLSTQIFSKFASF